MLDGEHFIGRLLQHVLPPGFKRLRHYGLLAPAAKAQRLALARTLLAMSAANPMAREDVQAFMRRVAAIEIDCFGHCQTGRWRCIGHLAAGRSVLAHIVRVSCRSPPSPTCVRSTSTTDSRASAVRASARARRGIAYPGS